jgi:hypothetical protein
MPQHHFDIFYQPPPEIRQHKDVCYTIKIIGGPNEYKEYMREKAARTARAKEAKRDAYEMKRALYESIVKGEKNASPEALKVPETLTKYKMELVEELEPDPYPGYEPDDDDDNFSTPYDEPPPEIVASPTWYDRVCSQVSKLFNPKI